MAPRKTQKAAGATEANERLVQTEDSNNDQIEYYKKQIILLQKELETCKTQILELESENKILKNANINSLNNDAVKISLNQKNVYSRVRNNKVLSPSPVAKKGCSCKGNCSNKICGCVKKGIQCQEFCRCNDAQCQNQELDKENIEQAPLTTDGEKALEKLCSLTLNQETLHASEKKIKKSIFSPYVSKTFRNGTEEKSYPASPLVFETRRKLFSQDSDDVVDVSANEHEKCNLENQLEIQPIKSPVKSPIKSPVKSPIKSPIKSPVPKRAAKLKNPDPATSKNVNNTESTQLKEKKSVQQEKDTKKNKNVKQLRKPIIVEPTDEEKKDEVFVSDESKIPKSPRVLRRQKSKSISPDCNVVKRQYNKGNRKVKSRSVSPRECTTTKNDSENKIQKLEKVQHSPQPYLTVTSITNVENIDTDKLPNEIQSSQEISRSFESNASGNTSNSSNHDLIDSSINPMVPKRQLARSPITAGTIIMPFDNKRFSPPPKKELAAAEVDWEQHQSELVQCKKCKRKFFPHRIDTHKKSCKGI